MNPAAIALSIIAALALCACFIGGEYCAALVFAYAASGAFLARNWRKKL